MRPSKDGPRLPDFLLIGAAKSGTTSLWQHIRAHPRVFMPGLKEPQFFAFLGDPAPYDKPSPMVIVRDLQGYAAIFEAAPAEAIIGEASTYYMELPSRTIRGIYEVYGPGAARSVRIVAIVRNPIERVFSQYRMLRARGEETLAFMDAIRAAETRIRGGWRLDFDYLQGGWSYLPLEAYAEAFEDVRVYLYEDLRDRPGWLMRDLYGFLGVEASFAPPGLGTRHHASAEAPRGRLRGAVYEGLIGRNPIGPIMGRMLGEGLRAKTLRALRAPFLHSPRLSRKDALYLLDYYGEDILRLARLMGRDLSHWLAPPEGHE